MSRKHLLRLGIQEQDISTLSSQDMSNASVWEEQRTRYSASFDSIDLGGYTYPNVMAASGTKWQAFALLPLAAEINPVAFHCIAPGSPSGLKFSDQDRAAVLYALQQTTHPSAFTLVKRMLDSALRY